MHNFQNFIGIDWSGAKTPVNTKSIAVAICDKGVNAPTLHSDIRSRTAVYDYIKSLALSDRRSLIGIDCNFGFSEKIGQTIFGDQYTYLDLWTAVEECNHHNANFFAGGFWEHIDYQKHFWTSGKMPLNFTMPKRLTEQASIENEFGRPESPFKLIGAKQVGKGGLAGMRMVYQLKQELGSKIAVWPFESIEACNQAKIVITEIFPRQFIQRSKAGPQKIRNAESLNTVLKFMHSDPYDGRTFTDHDTDAIISAAGLRYLCGTNDILPTALSNPMPSSPKTLQREGWIFGVGYRP